MSSDDYIFVLETPTEDASFEYGECTCRSPEECLAKLYRHVPVHPRKRKVRARR